MTQPGKGNTNTIDLYIFNYNIFIYFFLAKPEFSISTWPDNSFLLACNWYLQQKVFQLYVLLSYLGNVDKVYFLARAYCETNAVFSFFFIYYFNKESRFTYIHISETVCNFKPSRRTLYYIRYAAAWYGAASTWNCFLNAQPSPLPKPPSDGTYGYLIYA